MMDEVQVADDTPGHRATSIEMHRTAAAYCRLNVYPPFEIKAKTSHPLMGKVNRPISNRTGFDTIGTNASGNRALERNAEYLLPFSH